MWINAYFHRGVELPDPAMLLEAGERARMKKTRIHRDLPLPEQFVALVSDVRDLESP